MSLKYSWDPSQYMPQRSVQSNIVRSNCTAGSGAFILGAIHAHAVFADIPGRLRVYREQEELLSSAEETLLYWEKGDGLRRVKDVAE